MNYKTIGDYPSQLDDNQLKTYISILLNIADVDGISDNEMNLIDNLSSQASVSSELLSDCKNSYKNFDMSSLPNYHKNWVYCILRDAILIANCDDGISDDESALLQTIASYGDVDQAEFDLIKDITLSQLRISESWNSLLSV